MRSARSAPRTTSRKASPPSWPSVRPSLPIADAMAATPVTSTAAAHPEATPVAPTPQEVCAHMFAADRASQGLGMRIVDVGPGSARLEMAIRDDMLNGHEICHGGFITTPADSAFAFACNSRNEVTVASGLTVDFL